MTRTLMTARRTLFVGSVVIMGVTFALSANSQTPAAQSPATAATGGLSPARQAVDNRQAIYKLIGNYFKPLGAILKGSPYEAATAQKSIARLVFLSGLVDEAFPDISNLGDPETKAKPDVWTNRADFDNKVKEFQTHLIALQLLNDTDKAATEAFKTAATAVAQDCKGCHDTYRVK